MRGGGTNVARVPPHTRPCAEHAEAGLEPAASSTGLVEDRGQTCHEPRASSCCRPPLRLHGRGWQRGGVLRSFRTGGAPAFSYYVQHTEGLGCGQAAAAEMLGQRCGSRRLGSNSNPPNVSEVEKNNVHQNNILPILTYLKVEEKQKPSRNQVPRERCHVIAASLSVLSTMASSVKSSM